jgi:DNA-binding PadR family transcriptional regulator
MTMLDLVVICAVRKERTTGEILERLINNMEEETINYPNIYRVLKKTERLGYVTCQWEQNKKKYKITKKGQKLISKITSL